MSAVNSVSSVRANQILGNAYRVLGIGSKSSQADIHAANQAQKRSLKLGSQKASSWDLTWISTPERTEPILLDAVGRLAKLDSRLRERLFWFEEEPFKSRPTVPPTPHDRALWALLNALLEDPDAQDELRWNEVGKAWRAVGEDTGYWQRVAQLDQEGGFEPAATEGEVESLRQQSLHLALESVASRGRAAAFAGEEEVASRCLRILRSAGLDESQLYQLEESIAGPIVARIHQLCEEVQEQRNEVDRGDEGVVVANLQICERNQANFEQIPPLLNRLQGLVGESNALVVQAKEECAVLLHLLALDWTWADEFAKSRDVMVRAQAIGAGTPAEPRILARIAEIDEPAKREVERQEFFRSRNAYEVQVGNSYSTPRVCTCCLGEASGARSITGEYQSGNTKTTITMSFPICQSCTAHGNNSNEAVTLQSLVGFAILTTTYLLFKKLIFMALVWQFSAVASIGLTCWIMWLIAKKQKLIPLGKNCASRHFPVAMAGVGPGYAKVRFMHPDYAKAFAESNNAQVVPKTASKMGRDGATLAEAEGLPRIVGRQGWVVASLVGVSLLLAFFSGGKFAKFMLAPEHSDDPTSLQDTTTSTSTTGIPSTSTSTTGAPIVSFPSTTGTTGSSPRFGTSSTGGPTGLGSSSSSSSSSLDLLRAELSSEQLKLEQIKSEYDQAKASYEDIDARVREDRAIFDAATVEEQDAMRERLNQEVEVSNLALEHWQEVEHRYNEQAQVVNDLISRVNAGLNR